LDGERRGCFYSRATAPPPSHTEDSLSPPPITHTHTHTNTCAYMPPHRTYPAGPTCNTPTHPEDCEQVMITRDGGHSYTTVLKVPFGGSGTFNGYGDLGTHIPPPLQPHRRMLRARRSKGNLSAPSLHALPPPLRPLSASSPPSLPPAGQFTTIVGSNADNGTIGSPLYQQTWLDSTNQLHLLTNRTATFSGTPSAFCTNPVECGGGGGLNGPGVRLFM
jgi:hypothetical protein